MDTSPANLARRRLADRRDQQPRHLQITNYWIYALMAVIQLLACLSVVAHRRLVDYCLHGLPDLPAPAGRAHVAVSFATTMPLPVIDDNTIDFESEYSELRPHLLCKSLVVLHPGVVANAGCFYPLLPPRRFLIAWLPVSAVLFANDSRAVHTALNPLMFTIDVDCGGMRPGGVARQVTQSR